MLLLGEQKVSKVGWIMKIEGSDTEAMMKNLNLRADDYDQEKGERK